MALTVIHADIDAFFSAVEQLENPSIAGRPVIVGADPDSGRGVVSTASYEARAYGIRSAMPITKAYSLCPGGVFLRPNMPLYADYSARVMDIFSRYSPDIDQISIDEAFLDISATSKLFGGPVAAAHKMKIDVKRETGLTVSIGIASSRICAKTASDLNKPDGFTVCPDGKEREFLSPLPVSRLWGVGKKSAEILVNLGIEKIGDIANRNPHELESVFGQNGIRMWILSNGLDDNAMTARQKNMSIAKEHTFTQDVSSMEMVNSIIKQMADYLTRELRNRGKKYRTVSIKVRYSDFTTVTRAESYPCHIDDYLSAKNTAEKLFRSCVNSSKIRLIGVSLSNLSEDVQGDLFSDKKNRDAEELLDRLKLKYGSKISRGELCRFSVD